MTKGTEIVSRKRHPHMPLTAGGEEEAAGKGCAALLLAVPFSKKTIQDTILKRKNTLSNKVKTSPICKIWSITCHKKSHLKTQDFIKSSSTFTMTSLDRATICPRVESMLEFIKTYILLKT